MSPSGKIHNELWKRGFKYAVLASVVVYIVLELMLILVSFPFYSCINEHCFSNPLLVSIGLFLGYVFGKWITPDLDVFGITQSEWEAVRVAKIFGLLFVMYWMPYGYIFKGKHRSFWTHSYVISTLIRQMYAFWWIFVVSGTEGFVLQLVVFSGLFLGLFGSDGLHIYADKNIKEKV